MESTTASRPRKRRTQAERRAATRGALLDATIECLVDEGYTNTTTTKIVERAGVSRGAQVHHFPTKAELVAEAIRHLARKRAAEMFERIGKLKLHDGKQAEETLDLLWDLHSGPLFAASIELFVAARTDPELREQMVELEREVTRDIYAAATEVFPGFSDRPELRDTLDVGLAALRGLAMLNFVDPNRMKRSWPRIRRQLASLLAENFS